MSSNLGMVIQAFKSVQLKCASVGSNVGMVIQAFKSVQLKCSVFVGSSVGTQTVIQVSVSKQFINDITTYLFYLKCLFFALLIISRITIMPHL